MKSIHAAIAIITLVLAFGTGSRLACAQSQQPSDATTAVVASGVIVPQVVVDVTPAVEGTIQKIGPSGEFSAVVKKGDVLAQIDPARYRDEVAVANSELKRAEAGLRLAQAKLASAQHEFEKASKATGADAPAVTTAKSALEVARANIEAEEAHVEYRKTALARAEANVAACTIRSPIDGITIDRRINVGQIAGPNASSPSLFLIASDLKKLEIWATVPESDIGRIAKGQSATFTVAAFPNQTFKATVRQVRLNAAKTNQVTYTVVLDCGNADGRLLPYLSAKVAIQVGDVR
jgi:HlyD family secretion protein